MNTYMDTITMLPLLFNGCCYYLYVWLRGRPRTDWDQCTRGTVEIVMRRLSRLNESIDYDTESFKFQAFQSQRRDSGRQA